MRVAQELLGESTLKLVLTKGEAVCTLVNLKRPPTAAQTAAVMWRSPLCANEACGRRWTEIDHNHDWAKCHRTELHNLDPLCDWCHDLKTRENWSLVEGTGRRPFVPPDDPRHPNGDKDPPDGPEGPPVGRVRLDRPGRRRSP